MNVFFTRLFTPMKSFLAVLIFLSTAVSYAQTTEDFETETNGSNIFTDNGQTFTLTSQAGGNFIINALSPGTGWNGTAADSRYVDNNGSAARGVPVQFTVNSGTPFIVNNFWLFLLSDNTANIGSVTITGKLAGVTVYTASQSFGFNSNTAVNKGFSLIDLSNFGSHNNSNKVVDQIIIATGGNFFYVALDAFNWSITKPKINVLGNNIIINNGNATTSATNNTDFGTQNICSGTSVRTFTIKNSGTRNLIIKSVYIIGAMTDDYHVTIHPAATVAADSSTTFQVTFNPSGSEGPSRAIIRIESNDSDKAIYDVSISGYRAFKKINIVGNNVSIPYGNTTPSTADDTDFGSQSVCSGTIVRTFTIKNTGAIDLNISSVNITGPAAADYSVTTAPDARIFNSSTFQVTFNPSAAGTRNATITVNNDACSLGSYKFAISGFGLGDSIPPITPTIADVKGVCSVTPSVPTTTDECTGTVIGTTTTTFPITTQGTTVVKWTFNDGLGNITTANQNVILKDVTAPVISGCPGNISINANNTGCTSIATWTVPSAIDNCVASVIITSTHKPGDIFPLGITIVTYIFNDNNGNTSSCSFLVTVTNNMSASAKVTDALCNGTATGKVNMTVLGGNSSYTYDWNSGSFNTEDLTNVKAGTYRIMATDVNGCTATNSFTVSQPAALDVNTSLSSSTIAANNINPGVTYKWFNCATNTPVPGETKQTYTVPAPGNYAVIITEGGCSDTSTCVPLIITEVTESLNEDLFKIYPNPNTGSFTLFNTIDVDLKITDALSKVVYNNHFDKGQQHIEIKQDMGIYFIHYTHNGQTFTRKMVINK